MGNRDTEITDTDDDSRATDTTDRALTKSQLAMLTPPRSPGHPGLRAAAGPLHGHHEEEHRGVRGAAGQGLWLKGKNDNSAIESGPLPMKW